MHAKSILLCASLCCVYVRMRVSDVCLCCGVSVQMVRAAITAIYGCMLCRRVAHAQDTHTTGINANTKFISLEIPPEMLFSILDLCLCLNVVVT